MHAARSSDSGRQPRGVDLQALGQSGRSRWSSTDATGRRGGRIASCWERCYLCTWHLTHASGDARAASRLDEIRMPCEDWSNECPSDKPLQAAQEASHVKRPKISFLALDSASKWIAINVPKLRQKIETVSSAQEDNGDRLLVPQYWNQFLVVQSRAHSLGRHGIPLH